MHITHRHFVALPVTILLLLGSLTPAVFGQGGDAPLRASAQDPAEALHNNSPDQIVPLAPGTAAHVPAGTLFTEGEESELREGAVTVLTVGKVVLRAGSARIVAFDAAFHAAYDGHALSVAALTAPVLVERGHAWRIVPAHSQWRSADGAPDASVAIPDQFLEDQLRMIRSEPFRAQIILPPTLDAAPPSPLLLHDASGRGDTAARLFPLLARDPEMFALLSLHPAYRGVAWTLSVPEGIPKALHELRLLSLPSSDVLPEGISPVIIRLWRNDVLAQLTDSKNPMPFLKALELRAAPALARMRDEGYPERVALYEEAVQSFEREGTKLVDAGTSTILTDWMQQSDGAGKNTETEAATAEPLPVPQPAPVLSPTEVEREAYRALRDAGALFTVKTSIVATAPTVATVQSIVFGTSHGDRMFDIIYDVEKGEVSAIRENGGDPMLYALSMGRFREWVRK